MHAIVSSFLWQRYYNALRRGGRTGCLVTDESKPLLCPARWIDGISDADQESQRSSGVGRFKRIQESVGARLDSSLLGSSKDSSDQGKRPGNFSSHTPQPGDLQSVMQRRCSADANAMHAARARQSPASEEGVRGLQHRDGRERWDYGARGVVHGSLNKCCC
jgi:hypothetical protein